MTTTKNSGGRVVHFGQFVRWHRVNAGKTTEAYGQAVGLTARRVIAIEAMAEPAVQHTTLAAVARVMGMSLLDLDRAWRSTPVPVTGRKTGPTTDAATRFAAACDAAGVTTAQGLRRLRLWVIDQPPAVQRAALAHAGPDGAGDGSSPRFTAPVDHLQDPAAATAGRVAARAKQSPTPAAAAGRRAGRPPGASSARSPGSAATGGSKRR